MRLPKSASLRSAVQAYNADPNVTVAEFQLKKDYNDADVVLRWRTLSENGNAGFQVQQRAPDASSFEDLSGTFVESEAPGGTSTQEIQYSARLEDLAPSCHTLRLKQVDIDDQTSFSRTVEVEVPAHFALSAPYPNPFDESTQLDLTVPEAQHVTASVYNVLGQRVRILFDDRVEVAQTLCLKASSLASGLYLIRAEGDTFQEVRQVTLVC